jgi:hypothetical protein
MKSLKLLLQEKRSRARDFAQLRRHLLRLGKNPRGRPRTDVPDMNPDEVVERKINRANLSRRQRELTPKPTRTLGRRTATPNAEHAMIVGIVRELHREGETLTYTDGRIGTAYSKAEGRLAALGIKRTPGAIRMIWQRYKSCYV